jgi:hypothetical protein
LARFFVFLSLFVQEQRERPNGNKNYDPQNEDCGAENSFPLALFEQYLYAFALCLVQSLLLFSAPSCFL